MSTVVEIESAIEKLPAAELGQLLSWLDEYRALVGSSEILFSMYDEEKRKNGEGWTR